MAELQEVLELAKHYLTRHVRSDHYQLAYLGGSVAHGLQHTFSDIDIYLVDNSSDRYSEPTVDYKGFPIQINHVPESLFAEIETIANPQRFPHTNWRSIKASDDMMKMCTFAVRGPVIAGQQDFRKRCSNLDWNHFCRYAMSRGCVLISRELEDCAGALSCNQTDTAWLACRSAATLALSVTLAAVRDFYPAARVHLSILQRHEELGYVQPSIRSTLDVPLSSYTKHDDDSMRFRSESLYQEIRKRAAIASYLAGVSLLNGWNSRLQDISCPKWEDRGLRRNPFYCVQRFGDEIGIAGCDQGLRIGRALAQDWLALDLPVCKSQRTVDPRFPIKMLVERDIVLV
jgi:hypothetical protein